MGNIFVREGIVTDIPEEELEELRMCSTFEVKEICRLHNEFLRLTKRTEWLTKDAFLKIPCIEANPLRDRICLCFGYSEEAPVTDLPEDLEENRNDHEGESSTRNRNVDSNDVNNEFSNQRNPPIPPEAEFNDEKSREVEDCGSLTIGSETKTGPEMGASADTGASNKTSVTSGKNEENEDEGLKLNFRRFLIGVSLFNSYGRLEEKLKLAFRLQDFDNDDIISRAGERVITCINTASVT